MEHIFGYIQKRLCKIIPACSAYHIIFVPMFPDFRISEQITRYALRSCKDRIIFIFFKMNSILTVGYALCLFKTVPVICTPCKHKEKFSIMFYGASGETSASVMIIIELAWCKRQRQIFPVYKIFTDSMSPVHVIPMSIVRIKLVENMIFSFVIDQSVGVIKPACLWHKMVILTHLPLTDSSFILVDICLCFVYIFLH